MCRLHTENDLLIYRIKCYSLQYFKIEAVAGLFGIWYVRSMKHRRIGVTYCYDIIYSRGPKCALIGDLRLPFSRLLMSRVVSCAEGFNWHAFFVFFRHCKIKKKDSFFLFLDVLNPHFARKFVSLPRAGLKKLQLVMRDELFVLLYLTAKILK